MGSRQIVAFSAIFLIIVSIVLGTRVDHDHDDNDNVAFTKPENNSSVESAEENIAEAAKAEKKCKQYPSIPSEVPLTFESVSLS